MWPACIYFAYLVTDNINICENAHLCDAAYDKSENYYIIFFVHFQNISADKRDVKSISASRLRLLLYLLALSDVYTPRCRFYLVRLHELQPLHFRPFN